MLPECSGRFVLLRCSPSVGAHWWKRRRPDGLRHFGGGAERAPSQRVPLRLPGDPDVMALPDGCPVMGDPRPATSCARAVFTFVAPWSSPPRQPLRAPACLRRESTSAQETRDVELRVERSRTNRAWMPAAGSAPPAESSSGDPAERRPEEEVEVVLAHELGQHSSDHIPRGNRLVRARRRAGTYLLARSPKARRHGAPEACARPPVLTVLQLLHAGRELISRRMEAEDDWKALRSTDDPDAARGLFRGFANALADSDPPLGARLARLASDARPAGGDGDAFERPIERGGPSRRPARVAYSGPWDPVVGSESASC